MQVKKTQTRDDRLTAVQADAHYRGPSILPLVPDFDLGKVIYDLRQMVVMVVNEEPKAKRSKEEQGVRSFISGDKIATRDLRSMEERF